MWDSFIISPFINTLLYIYTLVGNNFGLAIILFTLLIRLLTYPLTISQLKGASAMQDLQKDQRWLDMQKKYKNNKEQMGQEQMKLYKELGVNPFASCLPTIIQFPIIIGLYQSITQSLATNPVQLLALAKHLYPSLLKVSSVIPLNSNFLWMDLGQPENLILPFLPFGIPILAIVVVVTTYVQGKMMTPPSAGSDDQGAQMGKMMNLYMPFLMGYLALTFASGLSLYFVASNVIGIIQYIIMGKADWHAIWPFGKTAKTAKPVRASK